jgi:hypothetical protein
MLYVHRFGVFALAPAHLLRRAKKSLLQQPAIEERILL